MSNIFGAWQGLKSSRCEGRPSIANLSALKVIIRYLNRVIAGAGYAPLCYSRQRKTIRIFIQS
ncbi:MAG: hypothetical protein ACI9BW_003407 [Gammaproteobacteria bacterium]|jgi:hypothetical protein